MEEHQTEKENRNEVVEREQQTYSTDILPPIDTVIIGNEDENLESTKSIEQIESDRKEEEEDNRKDGVNEKKDNEEGNLQATEIIEENEKNENNNDSNINNSKEEEEEEEEVREHDKTRRREKEENNNKSYEDKSMSKDQLEMLYKIPQKSNFKVYRPRTLNRRGREIVEVEKPKDDEEEEKVKEIEAIIVNPKVIDYFYNKMKNKPIFMKNLAKIVYILLNPDIESLPNLNEIYLNIIPFSATENSLSDLDIDNISKNTFKRVYKLYKKIQGDFIPEDPPDFKNLFSYISKILEYGNYNPPCLFPKIFITNKYLLGIGDVNQTNYFPNRIIYPEINGVKRCERKEKKIPKLYKNSEMYLKEISRPVSYPKEYNVNSK